MVLVRGSVAVDNDGVVTGSGYALQLFNMKWADLGPLPLPQAAEVPSADDIEGVPPLAEGEPSTVLLPDDEAVRTWLRSFPAFPPLVTDLPSTPLAPMSEKSATSYIFYWSAAYHERAGAYLDPFYVPVDLSTPAPIEAETPSQVAAWVSSFPSLPVDVVVKPTAPNAPITVHEYNSYITMWIDLFVDAMAAVRAHDLAFIKQLEVNAKRAIAKSSNSESFVIDYLKTNAVIPAGIPVETSGDEDAQTGHTVGPGSLT